MSRMLRIVTAIVLVLMMTACMSSEPKVSEAEQVTASQRASLQGSESAN